MASGYIPKQGTKSLYIGAQGAARRVKGLDKLLRKLAYIPQAAQEEMGAAVEQSADQLVDGIKAVAPSSDLEPHPGALKEAVKKGPGRTPLAVRVECNPVDAKGQHYGAHVEWGHRDPVHHVHVPAKPFFYLTVDRLKAKISRNMSAAIKRAVQRAS